VKPTGNCQLWQVRCAVHTRCSSDCDLIASCYSSVPLCTQADVGIMPVSILSQNCCLLLLAATLLYVQAVTWVGSINTTNNPTKSDTQRLSRTIMTPHLPLQHPSLNPLSFQLTICLTQLYIVCSVESAVFINTSFCSFTAMWYCLLYCFLCVISAGSTKQWVICHSYCDCCPHTRTVLHCDACLSILWWTYRVICSIYSRWWSQHWMWVRWPWGIAGQTQLCWWPARCEYNIQNCEVHTALLQMIIRPRHKAEACFCGLQRLGMGGAVPLLLLSAFMVWGETN